MSTFVWKKIGCPTLQPYTTAIRTYDGHSAQPQGVLMNVSVELVGKTMLINIKLFNTQLDYNLLLGRSYMDAMRFIASTVFQLLMFCHDGNIVTINQLLY